MGALRRASPVARVWGVILEGDLARMGLVDHVEWRGWVNNPRTVGRVDRLKSRNLVGQVRKVILGGGLRRASPVA